MLPVIHGGELKTNFQSQLYVQQRDPQSIFNQTRLKILKTNTNEVIFIIARKVTGDVHVPSGLSRLEL